MKSTREPTLKHLIDDLNSINNMKNNRFTILAMQLYAEHYVNQIVLESIGEPAKTEVKNHLSFPQKLRILENMKVLDKSTKRVLETLNTIRDSFVHELILTPEDIAKKLQAMNLGFSYQWKVDDKQTYSVDLEKVFLEKVKDKYNQLVISSIVVIGILYNQLKVIQKQKLDQFVFVDFVKNKDKWAAILSVREIHS